jgi:hypothetical protein
LLISTIIIVRLAGKAYLKWVSSNWIDFRGYGESDKSNDSNFYGTTNLANDVINLIDHLKLENIRLIGYSMGTVIRFIKYPSWVFFNSIDSHWWLIGLPFIFENLYWSYRFAFIWDFSSHCQVIFLYIGIFQTNWIRKNLIAFSLAKYRPLTEKKLLKFMFQLLISGQRFSSWNRTK